MKSIDYAIRKTAQDLKISEETAKIVVMEYWENVYGILISGSKTAIGIRKLGTFAMTKYNLRSLIFNCIGKIRRIKKSNKFTEEKKQEILNKEYEKLSLALRHRNEIAIQYAENFGNI